METERLIIRNFDLNDWQDLQEMIVKYQESEYAKYDHKWPTATEEIKSVTEWFVRGDSYLAISKEEWKKVTQASLHDAE